MTRHTREIKRRIDDFERKQSAAGRLEAYALGRVKLVPMHLIFVLSFFAAVIAEGRLGAAFGILSLLLIGEGLDSGLLMSIPRMIARGSVPVGRLYILTQVTAFVQLALSCFAALIAVGLTEGHFATACVVPYLVSAIMEAGLHLSHNKHASQIRMGFCAATLFAVFSLHMSRNGFGEGSMPYDTVGFLFMIFMAYTFISFAQSAAASKVRSTRDLLDRSLELSEAYDTLSATQEEARRLALVAQHANDSIFMVGTDGKILWINNAFTSLTGFGPEEVLGNTPQELFNGPDTDTDTVARIRSATDKGLPLRAEILSYRKDGTPVWFETNQVPVLKADGTREMTIAIERDISAGKAYEAELNAARRAAEEGEHAKARFLAAMSHEIRTPMNGIIGMTGLLRSAALPKEQASYVDTIEHSAEALMRIINDILDYSKLEAGKSMICETDFDLLACVEAALSILRPQAAAKNIYLDLDCLTALPAQIHGDDGHIRQILLNITGNAIKFTESGGVTLRLSCHTDQTGHDIRIEIKDTGIGIAEARVADIFDEFQQADGEITRQYGGTGLGLTISRLLAREMGGDITLTSELGKGSVFTLSLHLKHAVKEAEPAPLPEIELDPARLKGMKALVAEDNKTNRLVMQKYLKDTGLDVVYAENGREAVRFARRHQPRIVFMDMSMPEMDGLSATRAIRADDALKQPRIIALTANVYASDKAACLSAGMDGFLTKPLSRRDLMSCLAQL